MGLSPIEYTPAAPPEVFAVGLVCLVCAILGCLLLGAKNRRLTARGQLGTHELHKQNIYAAQLEAQLQGLENIQTEVTDLRQALEAERIAHRTLQTRVQTESRHWQEKIALLENADKRLQEQFKAVSQDVAHQNNQAFLQLAKSTFEQYQKGAAHALETRYTAFEGLVTPIHKALDNVDHKIQALEKERVSAYEVIKHQVSELVSSQKDLRFETANLVKALRTPHIRGRWGEMQLKRVVELTGMNSHCDFTEQVHIDGDEGRLRPDMIVRLPGGKSIIIDAKAPMAAYLDAIEENDDVARQLKMRDHARQVRAHIHSLSSRAYWDQFKDKSPEFVVLFLPGETFFTAALQEDPQLIELGVEKKVILTTPATLIAMLHAIAYGWRQETLARNAQEICDLGRDIYKRLSDMGNHMSKLGRDLNTAVKSYNSTVGTLERRVLPAARRFKALESTSQRDELDLLEPLESLTREVTAPELLGPEYTSPELNAPEPVAS